jgi:hypothetical protein
VAWSEELGGSDLVLTPAGCGRAFDEAEDASAARARPLTPYGELSTRLIISYARGSYTSRLK